VTFSHLRWNFVYQRPQHLLSRLAANRRIIFIEEPVYEPESVPQWRLEHPAPNVLVCQLVTPNPAPGFHNDHLDVFVPMVQQLLADQNVTEYVTWVYTPLAFPLAQSLAPQVVVYDCMDELSAFHNAPPQLLAHERDLLEMADLVFTGGPSLYRSKRSQHPHVYCFPSSVDAAHFRQAQYGEIAEAADQADLPHPRLGFYGVIDERLDVELLGALAEAHPEWQIVMVGPVVKIDPATLPAHLNITYMGQRSYDELPTYLAGWDVCMLPFAQNEATRFISPTKTLEYMAAERPIVSTPITDVAEPYGEIVYLGDTPEAFIAACEQALNEADDDRAARTAAMRRVLAKTSWDATAEAMAELIAKAVEQSGLLARHRPNGLTATAWTSADTLDIITPETTPTSSPAVA